MIYQYIRILVFLGMVTATCGFAGAAGMGIIAETQETSIMNSVGCPSPCECISESVAIQRWGGGGYERCSKTACGESSDAMVTYYCFRPVGSTVSSLATCKAPCECHTESSALAKWGKDGFTQCSKTPCGNDETSSEVVPRYCYQQWVSTVNVAAATTTAAATVSETGSTAAIQTGLLTQPPSTTEPSAPVSTATPGSSISWPASDAVPQETPVSPVTIITAIGTVVIAACALRPGNRE